MPRITPLLLFLQLKSDSVDKEHLYMSTSISLYLYIMSLFLFKSMLFFLLRLCSRINAVFNVYLKRIDNVLLVFCLVKMNVIWLMSSFI